MVGLIINCNSDVYYLPTLSLVDLVHPIVNCKLGPYEAKIVDLYSKDFKPLKEIYRVVDNKLVGPKRTFNLNRFSNNHIESQFIISFYHDPRIPSRFLSYIFLKYTLDREGVLLDYKL